MHWWTYEKEMARIETYENARNFHLLQCIGRLGLRTFRNGFRFAGDGLRENNFSLCAR